MQATKERKKNKGSIVAGSFPFFLTVFFHLLMMLSCLQYLHVNAGLKVHQLSDCSAFVWLFSQKSRGKAGIVAEESLLG